MSCYFRHIKDDLDEAGISVTPGNRKQIDQAIHHIVGVTDKECPQTWKRLKHQLADEQKRPDIISRLKTSL